MTMNKTPRAGSASVSFNSEGTPGAALPSKGLAVGGSDGTNLQDLSVDSSGKLNINTISGAISLPTGAATSALQGALTEAAPATDTASSGLNGRLQRIAQRLTSLIALFPSALGQTTKTGSLSVSVASDDDLQAKLGIVTETAPATDTASSGLNGRLQRIAQRLTTLLAVFPTTIDTNSGNKSASTLRVVLATDQPALTNKLLVTPDANSAVNIAQMNGVTTTMGAGNSDTGTQRVVVASNQSAIAVTIAATQAVNVAQMNGVTTDMGAGNSGTGTQRIVIATNQAAIPISGSVTANAPVWKESYRLDMSSSSVTTAAYTQIAASLANAVTMVEVYTTSPSSFYFATGAGASEVSKFYIPPGGNSPLPVYFSIASSTRISVKAIDVTDSANQIIMNFYG